MLLLRWGAETGESQGAHRPHTHQTTKKPFLKWRQMLCVEDQPPEVHICDIECAYKRQREKLTKWFMTLHWHPYGCISKQMLASSFLQSILKCTCYTFQSESNLALLTSSSTQKFPLSLGFPPQLLILFIIHMICSTCTFASFKDGPGPIQSAFFSLCVGLSGSLWIFLSYLL